LNEFNLSFGTERERQAEGQKKNNRQTGLSLSTNRIRFFSSSSSSTVSCSNQTGGDDVFSYRADKDIEDKRRVIHFFFSFKKKKKFFFFTTSAFTTVDELCINQSLDRSLDSAFWFILFIYKRPQQDGNLLETFRVRPGVCVCVRFTGFAAGPVVPIGISIDSVFLFLPRTWTRYSSFFKNKSKSFFGGNCRWSFEK
jgi:hypothetical protein